MLSDSCAALVDGLPGLLRAQRALFETAKEITTFVTLDSLEVAGEPRASDLAHRVGLDPSTVTRQVAHLRARGWVAVTPDPVDGRASRLSLTPAGAEELARLRLRVGERVQRHVDGWSEEDVGALSALIHRFAACTPRPPGALGSEDPTEHPHQTDQVRQVRGDR